MRLDRLNKEVNSLQYSTQKLTNAMREIIEENAILKSQIKAKDKKFQKLADEMSEQWRRLSIQFCGRKFGFHTQRYIDAMSIARDDYEEFVRPSK